MRDPQAWQTAAALAIVLVTAAVFIARIAGRRKSKKGGGGCGGGCGCPVQPERKTFKPPGSGRS
jgi:hypothetical protein